MTQDELELMCFEKAGIMIQKGLCSEHTDVFELTDLLIKMEQEKHEKNDLSDARIDYNDEIAEIEYVGEKETMDISVPGDNLFYCSSILTKNSFGVPATADMMFALISTEDLENLGQIMIKQLKNRYSDPTQNKRFVLGVDKTKMRFFDAEDNAQTLVQDTGPVFDSSNTASRIGTERKDFSGVKV